MSAPAIWICAIERGATVDLAQPAREPEPTPAPLFRSTPRRTLVRSASDAASRAEAER